MAMCPDDDFERGVYGGFVQTIRAQVELRFGKLDSREYAGVVAECYSVAARDGHLWGARGGEGGGVGVNGVVSGGAARCVAGVVRRAIEGLGVDAVESGGSGLADGEQRRCGVGAGRSTDDARDGVQPVNPERAGGGLSGPTAVVGRGANYERNLQWRAERKARKQRKKARQAGSVVVNPEGPVPEWRVAATSPRVAVAREGYFSGLSDETQTRLKESRAKALIARNEREAKEHAARVSDMDSPEAIFMKAMRMLDVAEQAAKKANDSKVAGWVQTIATSHSESIARSGGFSGVESFDSKTSFDSAGSVKAGKKKEQKPKLVDKKWKLSASPANGFELVAMQHGALTCVEVEEARTAMRRPLLEEDFRTGKFRGRLTGPQIAGARMHYDYSNDFE